MILSTGEGGLPGQRCPPDRDPLPNMNRDPWREPPRTETLWIETHLDRDPPPQHEKRLRTKTPLDRDPPGRRSLRTSNREPLSPGSLCTGRYASSYWNAFLSKACSFLSLCFIAQCECAQGPKTPRLIRDQDYNHVTR